MGGTYSKLRQKTNKVPQEQTENIAPVRPELYERPERSVPVRVLKRKSYDLYIDQIETLSTKTKMYFLKKGEDKSVTQMMREAIDEYIEKHR